MSRVSSGTLLEWARSHRRELIGWLFLAGWVLVLWAMASKYWHALKFFYWIAVFIVVPLMIIMAFKFLWKGEGSSVGAQPASGPKPLDDADKIV